MHCTFRTVDGCSILRLDGRKEVAALAEYPFVPKTNAKLVPGQFWAIPMSDGRFACGRVLRVDRDRDFGARTMFVGALLDWVGAEPPTSNSIAGAHVLAVGVAHVQVISDNKGTVLGERALALDGIDVPAEINGYWGTGYPVARAERRFIEGDPPVVDEFREVSSPLSDEMLRPAVAPTGVVQFRNLLSDDDFARLGEWFAQYPDMKLRAYRSYDDSIRDLEFLRHFPTLRRFQADALFVSLGSLDGLRHLPPELEELVIGETERRLDLGVLSRFSGLKTLYLERQTKGIEVLSELRSLEDLTLRSITLPDLSLLLPLQRLQSLDIKLGGTRDLGLLPRIGELRYLELWLIKGLSDISAVGDIPTLRYLFLQALRQVDTLPDLAGAESLRRVHLETMKGLRDLRPLATAPALEGVALIDMRHLVPADLQPLVGMPTLKAVSAGLGSHRKNVAAAKLLGLPKLSGPYDWRSGR